MFNPLNLFKKKQIIESAFTDYEIEQITKEFSWKGLSEVVDMKKATLFLSDLLGNTDSNRRKFDLIRFYQISTVVYACVDAISNAISAGKPTLKFVKDGQKVPVPDNHEAWKLIFSPNPFFTWNDIISALITDVELAGEAFNELVVPEGRPELIKEIWPLRTDLANHFFKTNGLPDRLEYGTGSTAQGGRDSGNRTLQWDKGEYSCLKFYNPLDATRGFSASNTIVRAVSIYRHSDIYAQKFFQNSGAISAIVKPTGENRTIPSKARENLEKQLQDKYSGSSKAFKMAVLSGQYDFQKISVDPKDADMETVKRYSRDDILSAFGVPPVAVGYLDGATYANAITQIQRFYRGTVFPVSKKQDEMWTKQVFEKIDPEIFYETDYSDVKELQDDKKIAAEVEKILTDAGNRTRNEIRALSGLQPLDGPDKEKGELLPVKQQKPVTPELEETQKNIEDFARQIEWKYLNKEKH